MYGIDEGSSIEDWYGLYRARRSAVIRGGCPLTSPSSEFPITGSAFVSGSMFVSDMVHLTLSAGACR